MGSEENSPILIAKMHILKLNPATLEVQRACPRKVLHLGVGETLQIPDPQGRFLHLKDPTHRTLLTSVSSLSRSNIFSMSMKLVWIILQGQHVWG